MKKVTALLTAMTMVLSLSACGSEPAESSNEMSSAAQESQTEKKETTPEESEASDSSEESQSAEVTTVTLWSMFAEDSEPTATSQRILKLVNDFNASHDNIQVEVSFGKTYDNIVTAIAAEGTPDIFQMYWQNAAPLSAKGALLNLTDYVNNDAGFDADDILPSTWELCRVDGETYSIPLSASTTYILYNPKVLSAAGWKTFPTTVEDLIQCAKDCYDVGGTTSMGLSPIFPWQDDVLWPAMLEAGWDNEDGAPAFDNEAIRKSYEVQRELIEYQGGYTAVSAWGNDWYSTRSTASDPVLSGVCAMRFQADSGLATLYSNSEGYVYGEDWEIATVPGNSMMTAGVYEINAKTANADAAWEVLSYISSPEAMAYLAEGMSNYGAFMPRTSALQALKAMDVSDPIKEAADLLMTAELQSFPMSGYVSEYLTAISTHMSQYLSGELDIDTAVTNVQTEIEAAIP